MEFFRDTLDGPVYIILVIVCVILIMAIIGFLMERKRLEKEAKSKIVHVDSNINPIEPVSIVDEGLKIEEDIENDVQFPSPTIDLSAGDLVIESPSDNSIEQVTSLSEEIPTNNNDLNIENRVDTPVIVFKEPDEKE